MEPRRLSSLDRNDRDRRDASGVGDLRGLQRLRDRIEAAARELDRLRAENAALVASLEGGDAGVAGGGGMAEVFRADNPDALRAQIEGFIAAIDEVLREPAALPDGPAEPAAERAGEATPDAPTPD